jgi:beta-N-acetylhexosaminidase
VDLDESAATLLAAITKDYGNKTIVTAFGNPYIGTQIPEVKTYLCTYSDTTVSAASLIKAFFGEIPIHGRLPVSIPGIAQRGAGLDR